MQSFKAGGNFNLKVERMDSAASKRPAESLRIESLGTKKIKLRLLTQPEPPVRASGCRAASQIAAVFPPFIRVLSFGPSDSESFSASLRPEWHCSGSHYVNYCASDVTS